MNEIYVWVRKYRILFVNFVGLEWYSLDPTKAEAK
jgi:hypothetical protein